MKKKDAWSQVIIWLVPWAGKMNQIMCCDWFPERARWSYFAQSGLPAVSHKKNFPKSHIINPLLIKLVQSRWLDIGLVLFLWVYGPWLLGPETHRKELSQYPAILTSHLVNNQDIYDRYFINLFRAIEVGCSCINYLMVLHPAWLVILATVLSTTCMAWHKFKILGISVYIKTTLVWYSMVYHSEGLHNYM